MTAEHCRAARNVLLAIGAAGFIVLAAASVGCRSTHYEGSSVGFYPPGSTPTTAWDYVASLYVTTQQSGSMYDIQDKTVHIRVEDRKGVRLLDDAVDLTCRDVAGRCTWNSFGRITVRLYEVDADAPPEFEDWWVEPHPPHARLMRTFEYSYDSGLRRFTRMRAE